MDVNNLWIQIKAIVDLKCLTLQAVMDQLRLLIYLLFSQRMKITNIFVIWQLFRIIHSQHRTDYIYGFVML